MASIHNTRTFFEAQTKVLEKIYTKTGEQNALKYPEVFNNYDVDESRSFFQVQSLVGFGTLNRKDEGQSAALDASSTGLTSQFAWVSYALRYIVTPEALLEDPKSILPKLPGLLRYSSDQTKEYLFWNILNLAFLAASSGGYNLADGQPLCSSAHTLTGAPGQTVSNTLGSVALTVETLQSAISLFSIIPDDRGLLTHVTPKHIVYPVGLHQTVVEVLQSYYYPTSNENRINAVAGAVEPHAVQYLTPFTGNGPFPWFVLADKGTLGMNSHSLFANIKFDKQRSWVDDATENLNHQTEFRASWGAVDWRGVVGSQGA